MEPFLVSLFSGGDIYKPRSIRKRTLGSISCIYYNISFTPTDPVNWVPLELLQDSDSSHITIALHWSSSYPEYLYANQKEAEQWRVVWSRLHSHRASLAKRLSKPKECYLEARHELNPKTTQVESSHEPLFRDTPLLIIFWQTDMVGPKSTNILLCRKTANTSSLSLTHSDYFLHLAPLYKVRLDLLYAVLCAAQHYIVSFTNVHLNQLFWVFFGWFCVSQTIT